MGPATAARTASRIAESVTAIRSSGASMDSIWMIGAAFNVRRSLSIAPLVTMTWCLVAVMATKFLRTCVRVASISSLAPWPAMRLRRIAADKTIFLLEIRAT